MNETRICKGIWIPIEIWESKDLTWSEKILLLEIDSFTSQEMSCYFSNEYIAKLLGVTENSANRILSSLIKKGYVKRVSFDGRRREVRSMLHYTTEDTQERICRLFTDEYADYSRMNMQTIHERIDNNTDNNTSNNINNNIYNINNNNSPNKENINKEESIEKEERKNKEKFDFKAALLAEGVDEHIVDDWLAVRKARKASNTQTALKGFLREVRKADIPIEDAVRICAERSWQGFKAEWMNKTINTKDNGNTQFKRRGYTDYAAKSADDYDCDF